MTDNVAPEYGSPRNIRSANRTETALDAIRIERISQDAKWGRQDHPDIVPWWDHIVPWWDQWAGCPTPRVDAADRAAFWQGENARRGKAGSIAWDGILLEEVYEALAEPDDEKRIAELVQVAAVAVAQIEAIERRLAARA